MPKGKEFAAKRKSSAFSTLSKNSASRRLHRDSNQKESNQKDSNLSTSIIDDKENNKFVVNRPVSRNSQLPKSSIAPSKLSSTGAYNSLTKFVATGKSIPKFIGTKKEINEDMFKRQHKTQSSKSKPIYQI